MAPQPAKTRANAAMPSASALRARSGRGGATWLRDELGHKGPDALRDLVADPADRPEVLARRVLEVPVLVALTRIDPAGIAAAHRDHDVRGTDGIVGQRLRELASEVDPQFPHGLDDSRIQGVG